MSTLSRPQSWIRVAPAPDSGSAGNVGETLSLRLGSTSLASSVGMKDNLTTGAQVRHLTIRCECGTIVKAENEKLLVDRTRLHFSEFHPDLGSPVPADSILAMAEIGEGQQ